MKDYQHSFGYNAGSFVGEETLDFLNNHGFSHQQSQTSLLQHSTFQGFSHPQSPHQCGISAADFRFLAVVRTHPGALLTRPTTNKQQLNL